MVMLLMGMSRTEEVISTSPKVALPVNVSR